MHMFSKKLFVNIICNSSIKHTEQSSSFTLLPPMQLCFCFSPKQYLWFPIAQEQVFRNHPPSPDTWSHKKTKNMYISFQLRLSKNRFFQQCSSEMGQKTPVFYPIHVWVKVQTELQSLTIWYLTHLFRAPPSTSLT